MRLLLGGLILLALFVAAALWQRSWTAAAHATRTASPAATRDAPPAADGWQNVVVGNPSGAEPYAAPPRGEPIPPSSPPAADPESGTAAVQEHGTPTAVTVRSGETLSEICSAHYGSAAPQLVQAVARFNHLEDADHVRAGQTLLLPPVERILPDPH